MSKALPKLGTTVLPKNVISRHASFGRLIWSPLVTSSCWEKKFGKGKLSERTGLSRLMVLWKQNLESKDLSFTTSTLPMLKQNNCTYNTVVKKALREEAKSTKIQDNTGMWTSSSFCLFRNRETDEELPDGEDTMVQNLSEEYQSHENEWL